MADSPIIVRATPAGVRRLQVVPVEAPPATPAGTLASASVAPAAPPTGLNAFLASAQRQGAALVDAAREQADRIASDARREGYEEGYAEAKQRAEREVVDLLAFAERIVREVVDFRDRTLAESDTTLVDLAIQVAEKILQARLELEPARVVDVLRGALRKAYVRDHLTVLCNPDDLALIEGATPELRASVGTLGQLELIGERRLSRGSVIVRTDAGDVDATLDSQLARLRDAMLGGKHE